MNKDNHSLLDYDVKVLLALIKSLHGDRLFFKFLLKNGYPELAAWSNAVRGDIDALHWLFNNGFGSLGVLSNAIDGEKKAVEWVRNSGDLFLINFSAACRGEMDGLMWLKSKDATIFILMVKEIKTVLKTQMKENLFWYKWR